MDERDRLPDKQESTEYSWRICAGKINVLEIKMGLRRYDLALTLGQTHVTHVHANTWSQHTAAAKVERNH